MIDTDFSVDTVVLSYLTDEDGNKTGVVLPIEFWTEIVPMLELEAMKQKLRKAFLEMKAIRKGELPRVTLKEFLDEL